MMASGDYGETTPTSRNASPARSLTTATPSAAAGRIRATAQAGSTTSASHTVGSPSDDCTLSPVLRQRLSAARSQTVLRQRPVGKNAPFLPLAAFATFATFHNVAALEPYAIRRAIVSDQPLATTV